MAMEILERLEERYPGRISATAGPQSKRKHFAEMEHARQTGEKSTQWQMGCLSGCGGVFYNMDILHDGTIVPCHMLAGVSLGNITTDSIEDVWLKHPHMVALRERRLTPMQEVLGCQDCEWASYCNGGCPGMAFELTGDYNRADSHDCYRRFLFQTGAINVIRS
jgi:radical SAM protein with 4Fe4S-binding SPASM domain